MNVLRFDSEQSWVSGLATFWRDRLHLNPALRHCLASGNSPIPIYREMVRATQQNRISFRNSAVFALDEFGGLPADDSGRCANMLKRDLIDQIDLPQGAFHWPDPDAADLEGECARYDQAITPGFDLAILGIGLNGHLGMNEPGSARESLTRRTMLHGTTIVNSAAYFAHRHLPEWGVTVGMKQLLDSKEVWLIATGRSKAEIVQRILCGKVSEEVPATLMREHSNCSLWIDAAAGSQL